MAISLLHLFQSAKGDGPDPTRVQPSNWNAQHVITMATAKILGRTTAGTGAVEELAATTYGIGIFNLANIAAALTYLGAAAVAHVHAFSTLTGLPTTLAGYGITDAVTHSQIDDLNVYIERPADGDYDVWVNASYGFTINEITTDCISGTCTLTGKIDTTNLGGTANSVSATETTQAHASANVVAAGQNVRLTISANATCLGLSVKVKFTRVLA